MNVKRTRALKEVKKERGEKKEEKKDPGNHGVVAYKEKRLEDKGTAFFAGDCNCECMKSKGLDGKAQSLEVKGGFEVLAFDIHNCDMKNESIAKRFGPGNHMNLRHIYAMRVKKNGGRRLLSDVDMTTSEGNDFLM